MIQLHRNADVPDALREQGAQQTDRDCLAYEASPKEYISHAQSFPYREYYKSQGVKYALIEMSHNKCCYCESNPDGTGYGNVEHFRPKGAVKQQRGDSNEYPGYYWLAYSWENLLWACERCNKNKGTLFPLEDPGQRARSRNDDLAGERALFVNPAEENPRDHIRFDEDLPVCQTERGRCTMEGVDLRRAGLRENRLKRLRYIETLIIIAESGSCQDDQSIQDALSEIEKATEPDAEFSSMVVDLIAQRGFRVGDVEQAGN